MKSSTIGWIVVVILVVLGIWWWSSSSSSMSEQPIPVESDNGTGAGPVATSTFSYEPGHPLLAVASNPTLGNYLVADNGMTLYLYTKDATNTSTCYDQCAIAWPPYTVSATDDLSGLAMGVDPSKVSRVARTDGTYVVAYNGMPLYFWQKDMKPGDTTGQDVGKVWYVVAP
jgi:predicted lipoprotein with Yx(FWY)xxD motif